jgi:hypothetical protein
MSHEDNEKFIEQVWSYFLTRNVSQKNQLIQAKREEFKILQELQRKQSK